MAAATSVPCSSLLTSSSTWSASSLPGPRRTRGRAHALRSGARAQSQATGKKGTTTPTATEDVVELGKSGVRVSAVGVGAWAWGDRFFWGFGGDYGEKDVQQAFSASNEGGLTFVDTAEVYGNGMSEQLLGRFAKTAKEPVTIATKFAPLPWRLTSGSVVDALRASLSRLDREFVELYMLHWPAAEVFSFGPNNNFLQGLADCHALGLAKAVGVSNYNVRRLRDAHRVLEARNVPLASNQVQYSLVYRKPEYSGLLETCQELGVTLVAYSPLAQGLLTGKFTPQNRPKGARGVVVKDDTLRETQKLVQVMKEVGAAHGGKTPTQVALNWVVCKGALPIPGVKNERQARECAGALGWRLTPEEVLELERSAASITVFGAPFEGNE
eukprot:jgi/Chlat1/2261/Chrsp17S02571